MLTPSASCCANVHQLVSILALIACPCLASNALTDRCVAGSTPFSAGGLHLVNVAESFAAKGKAYKAAAKEEALRAESAIVAGRALQAKYKAALARIRELECASGAPPTPVDDEGAPEFGSDLPPSTPLGAAVAGSSEQVDATSTPVVWHEAEFDLGRLGTDGSGRVDGDGPLVLRIVPAAGNRVQLLLEARASA